MHRIAAAAAVTACTGFAHAGGSGSPREVQVRSINFEDAVIEVYNFSAADIDLTGWRFCTHDFNEARRYSGAAGFNGVTIEAATSVYIHINNDAPAGNPDRFNRADLGGAFATPLDQDAYGLQFYFPAANGSVSFGNSSLIADHLQWNIDGESVGSAEFRTGQAVSQGLWSATGDFIATTTESSAIELNDLSGDEAGSPGEYDVLEGPLPCSPADLAEPFGALNFFDVAAFIGLFNASDPAADLAEPIGSINFFDVAAYINLFNAGCP
ncbi:MAG: GC-type dockerin domain-anchored protein [Planctomycetota bacterium]